MEEREGQMTEAQLIQWARLRIFTLMEEMTAIESGEESDGFDLETKAYMVVRVAQRLYVKLHLKNCLTKHGYKLHGDEPLAF